MHEQSPRALLPTGLLKKQLRHRSAFTAVETLFALTITAMAAGAAMSSIAAGSADRAWIVREEIARGLGRQLLDEISAAPFPLVAPDPYAYPPYTRFEYDSIDDYDSLIDQPPQNEYGEVLGTDGKFYDFGFYHYSIPRLDEQRPHASWLTKFRRTVTVEMLERDTNGDFVAGAWDSPTRRVGVVVSYVDDGVSRELFNSFAMVSHVPPTP